MQIHRGDTVLDASHRVEHDRERALPETPEQVSDPARQPIVRVDKVVANTLADAEQHHLLGEARQQVEQLVLADVRRRAS
jgi:hypothetical protein